MTTLIWIIGVIIAIALLYFAIRITIGFVKSSTVVHQGEAVIINRSGRFNRVAGPGIVIVYPKIENIQRTIETRNRPLDVSIPDILAYGVLHKMTLNFWCSFEPQKLAAGDKAKMAELVGKKESERQSQIEARLRDMLESQITVLQEQMPIPEKSADRINALASGSTRANALKKKLTYDLKNTLASLGLVLDTQRPILLTTNLSDDLEPPPGAELPDDEPRLTQYDLAILKSIPRNEVEIRNS